MSPIDHGESKLPGSDEEGKYQQSSYQKSNENDATLYYMRLGVSKDATQHDIRRAFLKLSQNYHTDKYMTQPEFIQELMNTRFQQLQEAYSVLSDVKKRAAYDAAGVKGVGHLALVPRDWTSTEDIIRYVRTKEMEGELFHTAKMLSATSNITITYSVAHWSPFLKRVLRTSPLGSIPSLAPRSSAPATLRSPNARNEVDRDVAVPAPTSPRNTGTSPNNQQTMSASILSPASAPSFSDSEKPDSTTETKDGAGPHSQMHIKGEMGAIEIDINGQRQLVLIPPREVQDNIRKTMELNLAQTGGAGSCAGGARHSVAPLQPSAALALMLTVLPHRMLFQHSFEHSVSPKLNFVFGATALTEGKVGVFSMGTTAEYKKNFLTTYTTTVQSRKNGLKISLSHRYILDRLWVLRSKLTLLDSVELLQKLQLSLVRKLSLRAELENTIAWSLTRSGFFQSTFTRVWENGSQCLVVRMGEQILTLSALMTSEVAFGVTGEPAKEASPKSLLQYRVTSSLLSGTTQMGLEIWFYHRPLKHYGLGFMTEIPYAPSLPSFSPYFGTISRNIMSNQISLLYRRGKHSISIPIVVVLSPTISHSLMWVSLPLCFFRLGKFLYHQYAKAKAVERAAKLRSKHITELDIARAKAMLEQKALEWKVLQSCAEESSCEGLVIINAQYGVLNSNPSTPGFGPFAKGAPKSKYRSPLAALSAGIRSCSVRAILSLLGFSRPSPPVASPTERDSSSDKTDLTSLHPGELDGHDDVPLTLDVTVALQSLVRDSKLLLPEGPKSQLVGFCDPHPYALKPRQLKITYWFRKKRHYVVFSDEDPVELPQREHLLPPKTRS